MTDQQPTMTSREPSAYIQQLIADAPPLSQEQRAKLAELLAPVRRHAPPL